MVAEERKEKVLHTRIPAALEEQIKRLAEGLRVPVSNLVRNMLEDALDMTRRVRESRVFASDGPAARREPANAADVYGWQSLTLNITVPCTRCGIVLEAGDSAFVGLTDIPRAERVIICPACVPKPPRKRSRGASR